MAQEGELSRSGREPVAPRRAVLLAAGGGARLRPLTNDRPKALVQLAGRPLIDHALEALEACGVELATVVTGHGRGSLVDFLEHRSGRVGIEERYSERFAETNNAVSLACARDRLEEGAWIVETDVIAEPQAWRLLASSRGGEARWLAAPFGAGHDGAMLEADERGRLKNWTLRSSPGVPIPAHAFKSMGIVLVEAGFGRRLALWLEAALRERRDGLYFDEVIAAHLDDSDVRVVDAGAARWAEIDSPEDLAEARRLFEAAGNAS